MVEMIKASSDTGATMIHKLATVILHDVNIAKFHCLPLEGQG